MWNRYQADLPSTCTYFCTITPLDFIVNPHSECEFELLDCLSHFQRFIRWEESVIPRTNRERNVRELGWAFRNLPPSIILWRVRGNTRNISCNTEKLIFLSRQIPFSPTRLYGLSLQSIWHSVLKDTESNICCPPPPPQMKPLIWKQIYSWRNHELTPHDQAPYCGIEDKWAGFETWIFRK
jgi:hypothetical protein